MSWLNVDISVHSTLYERDHVINVKIAIDELAADAASAPVHRVDDLGIYVLDELIALASATRTLLDASQTPDSLRMSLGICSVPRSFALRMSTTIGICASYLGRRIFGIPALAGATTTVLTS